MNRILNKELLRERQTRDCDGQTSRLEVALPSQAVVAVTIELTSSPETR